MALGFAFFVLVGLYGFIQSYWPAQTILVVHTVEIPADAGLWIFTTIAFAYFACIWLAVVVQLRQERQMQRYGKESSNGWGRHYLCEQNSLTKNLC